jgi:Aminoglycoside-2''-adenylyltransferase
MSAAADEWERLRPDDVAALLADLDAPWWIAGGWALDLFLDAETRTHGDIDVAVLRRDQLALHRLLSRWDLRYATPEHTLEPWDGQLLAPPVHGVWARRSPRPGAPWTFEVLLDEHRGDCWVYRRDPAISRALVDLGGRRNGIPYLRPEVVLLYKSKNPTSTDEIDFDAVEPRLTGSARSWLRDALTTCAPEHPWLARLADA